MKNIVSSTEFTLESATGERTSVTIEIGTPASKGNKNEEWHCQYKVHPPMKAANRAIGEDSLQSLILATYAAINELKALVESGSKVLCSNGECVPLAAYDLSALSYFEQIGDSLGHKDT